MNTRPKLILVEDAPPSDDFAEFLRSLSTARADLDKLNTAIDDTNLFRWATSRMAWERAVAKEHGKRITPVRGITKLRAAVTSTLMRSDLAASVRGNLAARNIEAAVRESYGVEDAA